jgi:formate hydrogenlyase subunit 3/multisubunit Na+/H+ antiporter MnhD subunit
VTVFDQINGLPVHALVIHAAVVFVPLLALVAIVYAVVPRWRAKVGWAAVLLAIAAPATAWVATQSGGELRDRLVASGLKGEPLAAIDDHMGYGDLTLYFSLGLGVVTLIMIFLTLRRSARPLPRVAELGFIVIVLGLAAFAGYFVFMTGDSGAQAVWGSS